MEMTEEDKASAAKAGYDAALKLTDKLARTIWSVYSALVGTNAFLVALATFLAIKGGSSPMAVRMLGGLGLLICCAWYLMNMRSFDYYSYFFAWARNLEGTAFGNVVEMIRKGEEFSKGGGAKIGDSTRRMRWGARFFKVEYLINAVIFTFGLLYAIMALGSWSPNAP